MRASVSVAVSVSVSVDLRLAGVGMRALARGIPHLRVVALCHTPDESIRMLPTKPNADQRGSTLPKLIKFSSLSASPLLSPTTSYAFLTAALLTPAAPQIRLANPAFGARRVLAAVKERHIDWTVTEGRVHKARKHARALVRSRSSGHGRLWPSPADSHSATRAPTN